MSKPLKVCFISLDAYPFFAKIDHGTQGGAELDIYMISSELAKDPAYKVCLITGDFGQQDIEMFENVTIYKSANLQNPFKTVLSIWGALKKADCDIYCKKGASFTTGMVALFCRMHRRKFVLRTARLAECDGSYIESDYLRGLVHKWTLKTAAHIFVQNRSDQQLLKNSAGVSSTAVPNGHRIQPCSQSERKFILWVGRSATVKCPYRFIDLAKQFGSEQFVMICQKANDDPNYSSLVAAASTVPNLQFIERVAFHQIGEYFAQAKMLVNTSDAEGFPNTFIQACSACTPILSYKVNPDDFLTLHKCGLCSNGDAEEFKRLFSKLLNSESSSDLGNNGYDYVRVTHDISSIVQQYKTCFGSYF